MSDRVFNLLIAGALLVVGGACILAVWLIVHSPTPPAAAPAGCETFSQTSQTVCGRFLAYWREHGGLTQQGYPLSGELQEVSPINGQTYTTQYFERAVFEYHPENQPPYDVLLSQLGTFRFRDQHGAAGTPAPTAAPTAAAPTATPAPAANVALVWRLTGGDVGAFKSPGGIALDSQQNLYVVDLANDRVQKFDTAGHYLLSWGSYGEGPGLFSFSNSAGVTTAAITASTSTSSSTATRRRTSSSPARGAPSTAAWRSRAATRTFARPASWARA